MTRFGIRPVTDYTYDNAGRIDTIKQQSQQGGNAVAEKYVDFVFDGSELKVSGTFILDHPR